MTEDLASSRNRVTEVVRGVLASGFGGQPKNVPETLVSAVVDGRGDGDAVSCATRESFGDTSPMELVLFDTDQIGNYVFESSRPPVIAGASKILSTLNWKISQRYRKNVIFSGGGEGILLVPAGEGGKICDDIAEMYVEHTDGALGVTTEHLPVAPIEFIVADSDEDEPEQGSQLVSGTSAVLARIRDRIRLQKEQRLPGFSALRGGEARCVSCRDRAGTIDAASLRKELPGKLCPACAKRWGKGKALIAGVSLEAMVSAFGQDDGHSRSKRSYIGFLYADGNAMGALFGRLQSLAELRFLSLAVAHVFRAVQALVKKKVAAVSPKECELPPLLSFLGGGDEAIWILPAVAAVSVAEELAGWVEGEAKEIVDLSSLLHRAGLRKLTVGTGLVLCEHKYPVRYQFELAKLLQKNAKRLFYDSPLEEAPSSLDFEVLTDASPASENLEAVRKIVYGTEDPGFTRICRPYTTDALGQLLERMRAAGSVGVGKAQLFALQTGAAEGKRLFLNYLLYQITRNRKRYQPWLDAMEVDLQQSGALEHLFIQRLDKDLEATWIPDALQLAPFLDKSKGVES